MEIKEIGHEKLLNEFVGSNEKSQFLQSWQWGDFQKSQQNNLLRLGIFEHEKLIGSAQIVEQTLPLGKKYWYCPRGPLVNEKMPVEEYQLVWQNLLEEIVGRANAKGIMFVKIEPPIEKYNKNMIEGFLDKFTSKQVDDIQPQDTLYLDLAGSEEELLSAMHQKTRYNIRLAEKKGVSIRTKPMIDDFETFWKLIKITTKRDKFQAHSRQYYHDMYRQLIDTDFFEMFIAELKGKIIAMNLVTFFGDTVTYLHGVSSDEERNVMAPHLLQWKQIQAAKQKGFRYYDYWGIAPEDHQNDHRWSGITRFKIGFGGQAVSFVGAYDIILDNLWYKIYKAAQKFRLG